VTARNAFCNLSDDESEREIIHVKDHSWKIKWRFSINIKTSLLLPREINNITANAIEWGERERVRRGQGTKKQPEKRLLLHLFDLGSREDVEGRRDQNGLWELVGLQPLRWREEKLKLAQAFREKVSLLTVSKPFDLRLR